MPFSVEATLREAKRKAAQQNRRCVVHLEEGRMIPLIADAMAALGLTPSLRPYPHARTAACRVETIAQQKARRSRVSAALDHARQIMTAHEATLGVTPTDDTDRAPHSL